MILSEVRIFWSSAPYRQRISRAIGHYPPLLGTLQKRIILSICLAVPAAAFCFAICDNPFVPDGIRYVICPGWWFGLHLTTPQACGGFFDCLGEVGRAIGQMFEITVMVNPVVFSIVLFLLLGLRQRNRRAKPSVARVAHV